MQIQPHSLPRPCALGLVPMLASVLALALLLTQPAQAQTPESQGQEPTRAQEPNTAGDYGYWPSFRGAFASGFGSGVTPVDWDGETGHNIVWKTAIPGLGHSSPVIWGSRLFLTTAVAAEGDADLKVGLYGSGWSADDGGPQSWRVLCLDRHDGRLLWEREAHRGEPKIQRHPKSSHASPTVATDGRRVVALFGSEGLYVYDMEGNLQWKKDLGVLHSGSYRTEAAQWGYGSSPTLFDDKVVVQADVFGTGFLVVFDATDGKELWRVERDENPTWSTPTVYPTNARILLLVNGYHHMGAYDFGTGEEVWKLSGGGDIPVPTPVTSMGLVFLTNAHGAKSPVYAVRAGARGDLTLEGEATSNDGIAWSVPRGGAYMQTPLVVGNELYVCRDNGVLSCFDARSGERHYQERLASSEGFTASAVTDGNKIYFTSEMGNTHVLKPGTSFERLAINALGETVMATPAIADGTIYIRGRHHLMAIREMPRDSAPADELPTAEEPSAEKPSEETSG